MQENEGILENVANIILEEKPEDYGKRIEKGEKLEEILHLSEVRGNIISWYPGLKGATVLQLNAGYGEVTGALCQKAEKVIAIEENEEKAKLIRKRYETIENLIVMGGNLENIAITELVDFVVAIDINDSNIEKYVAFAKKYVKEEGRIIITGENRFGMKAWATSEEERQVVNNKKNALSRKKCNNLFQKEGLFARYAYPLPDDKLTNVIFTENHLPDVENMSRNLVYKQGVVSFSEVDAYRAILEENASLFPFFANSFFVELGKKELPELPIKWVSYANMRKDKYRIQTIIGTEEVTKTAANKKAQKHIEKMKKNIDIMKSLGIATLDYYEGDCIKSHFVKDKPTLDKVLLEIYREQGLEGFITKVKEYAAFLQEKLQSIEIKETQETVFEKYKIAVEKEQLQGFHFVQYGLWDLLFQNCFVIEGKYYFYDQEWLEEIVPVEFMIYRAILYYHELHQYVTIEQVWGLLGYGEKTIEVLKQLDDKIQEKIRKPLVWNLYTKQELESRRYRKLKEKYQKQVAETEERKAEIKQLQEAVIEKNNEVQIMKSSISWKITKPLRNIRGIGRKK